MLAAYGQALTFLFQPMNLVMLTGAIIIGLFIGILPGIGGLAGAALLLPLLFHMEKTIGLICVLALLCVVYTSGCITSILLNIPGEDASAATLLDGFPMCQKGEASRAIGASVTASMFGGVIPVFLAMLMIPILMPVIMAFKLPEMTLLIVLGLSFIATLTGRSAIKGEISAAFGLLLALVGFHTMSGVTRFTFGTTYLYEGVNMVSLFLGLFGLAELVNIITKGQVTISQKPQLGGFVRGLKDTLQGAKDVWRHKWLWFRSTLIGYIVGLIPGIGGTTAVWVAYGHAKQTSKHPEEFGKGCVEGVIAPESADNAKSAGGLLTTMAFGIPGSTGMALFMGAFLMAGVTPGPKMLVEHLPLGVTLLLGIALANIIGAFICFFTAPYLSRVASIHMDFLYPIILCLALTGAFAYQLSIISFIEVIFFTVLGFFMTRFGYSRPALVLGFVLGELLEYYSSLAYKYYGALFFVTPVCFVLIAILIGLYSYPYLKKVLPRLIGGFKKA